MPKNITLDGVSQRLWRFDVDDTPVNAAVDVPPSSNWAFDHDADADAHHSAEVAQGRVAYGATELLAKPGCVAFNLTTEALVQGRVNYEPFVVATPITVESIVIEITGAAGGGNKCRLGIYNADTDWQPTTLVVATAEVAIDANAVVTTAIAATVLQEGRYLVAITCQANVTVRAIRSNPWMFVATTFAGSSLLNLAYVTKAYAALAATGTVWDTPRFGTGGFHQVTLLGISAP